MNLNYFIYISISKSSVSFGYWQEGASKPLTPFTWSEWPVPLSFYCSPNGIVMGEEAERAVANKWTGAYRDWFSQLSTGENFEYMAKTYPIRYLFLLAAEEQFRRFFRQVLYEGDGALESMRGNLSLLLSFDDNVPDNQRILVSNLFRDGGYGKVLDVFGNAYIASYYGKKYPGRNVLIMDSDGYDLFLSLYDPLSMQVIDKRVIEGFGADPRVEQLCDILWQKTEADSYWLNKKDEYEKLKLEVIKLLESEESEMEGDIVFSNDRRLSYFITRREINNIRVGNNMDLPNIVGQFIAKNNGNIGGLAPLLVLRNYAVSNRYFYNTLKNQFDIIILVTDEERDNYGQLLVEDVYKRFNSMPQNLGSVSRNITESASNQQHNEREDVSFVIPEKKDSWNSYHTDIQTTQSEIKSENTGKEFGKLSDHEASQEEQVKNDVSSAFSGGKVLTADEKKQIRLLLVESKTEAKKGNMGKACSIFQDIKSMIGDALGQLPKSTLDLFNEIENLIKNLNIREQAPERKYKTDIKEVPPVCQPIKKEEPKVQPKPPQYSEAMVWLEKREYLKAKEAFRAEGNEKMASLCIELNKAARQFKILLTQYDGCLKNRNIDNAKKAVKEINHFIGLLQQAGLKFDNEMLLQNKYKTIK